MCQKFVFKLCTVNWAIVCAILANFHRFFNRFEMCGFVRVKRPLSPIFNAPLNSEKTHFHQWKC